jgi:hypothetical protein
MSTASTAGSNPAQGINVYGRFHLSNFEGLSLKQVILNTADGTSGKVINSTVKQLKSLDSILSPEIGYIEYNFLWFSFIISKLQKSARKVIRNNTRPLFPVPSITVAI